MSSERSLAGSLSPAQSLATAIDSFVIALKVGEAIKKMNGKQAYYQSI
jgi:hypothetical protein